MSYPYPQVMLDQTGHSELSDFVRIMVFNTSDPSAKEVVGDLSQLRAATAGRRGERPGRTALPAAAPQHLRLAVCEGMA